MTDAVPGAYLVGPGVLAGRYPDTTAAALLEAGVATFVDLTEGDLPEYASHLPPSVAHHRVPVPDFTSPSPAQVREALDLIATTPGLVYLHCEAGCGRTGTVAGCYLVEHGMPPAEALGRVRELTGADCPPGADQIATILGWSR